MVLEKCKVSPYTFDMDYSRLEAKQRLLASHRPLTPSLLANLEAWLRVELTYTSNALEGNTLTRQETALVVEMGLTVGGKTLREHLEASNHAKALDQVLAWVRARKPVDERQVLDLHALVLHGILDEHAGRYRSVPVRISGSRVVLPNPRKVPELMAGLGAWLARGPSRAHPVAFASEAHYRLVSIHPFVDGNGRTARLLMNLLLLRAGYTPALIRTRDRLAYVNSLEEAQLGGSKEPYEALMLKAVERTLDLYLDAVGGKPPRPEPVPSRPGQLRIGALAKQTGETPATLRHWLKLGLLPVAGETEAGYVLFEPGAAERVAGIRRLQGQRLSLGEIKDKLGIG